MTSNLNVSEHSASKRVFFKPKIHPILSGLRDQVFPANVRGPSEIQRQLSIFNHHLSTGARDADASRATGMFFSFRFSYSTKLHHHHHHHHRGSSRQDDRTPDDELKNKGPKRRSRRLLGHRYFFFHFCWSTNDFILQIDFLYGTMTISGTANGSPPPPPPTTPGLKT
jgi:hypothetical protein